MLVYEGIGQFRFRASAVFRISDSGHRDQASVAKLREAKLGERDAT
jgi:hypothetical protein